MADARRVATQMARRYFKNPRDQAIFLRQMNQEAGFRDATSPAGAQGPAQIMPATARAWGVTNVHDPVQAYQAAAEHMRAYYQQFGHDWAKALTAYNAGPGAVGGKLPAETQNYISSILGGKGDGGASAAAAPSSPTESVQLAQRKTFDQAGFDQAKREFVLGTMIARHEPDSILLKSGVLSTSAPNPSDFESSRLTSKTITSGGGGSPSGGGGSAAADFATQRVGRYQENLGSNRGSELDVLENRFGMRGQPWCAIFATTAASHGGASSAVRTASVAQIRQWASEGSHGYAKGLLPADAAQPGDLLTFGDAHVGVVERRLGDGRVQTVEGNTSTGGVRKVIRSPGEGQVARPVYAR